MVFLGTWRPQVQVLSPRLSKNKGFGFPEPLFFPKNLREGFWPFEDLKVEDAYNGEHSTYQTNPLIDHGLYMSGVMDTWGQGFGLIRDECEKTNAPLPDMKATEKNVTVTIHASMKYAELLKNISSSTEGIPPVIPPVKIEIPPVTPPVKKNKSAEAIQVLTILY